MNKGETEPLRHGPVLTPLPLPSGRMRGGAAFDLGIRKEKSCVYL